MRIRNAAAYEYLIQNQADLLTSISSSTMEQHAKDMLTKHCMLHLDTRTHHQKIEDAVRTVLGALPIPYDKRQLTGVCIKRIARDLAKHGLEEEPSEKPVRVIIRKFTSEMKREK
jgi:hypothetical protein